MPNTNSPRRHAGFQYRLRFFHRCRFPVSHCCDPGQIDRFQVQGSAIESTCGEPIVVVLLRYKHDPDSGLSRECQRAQFAPGAASFAVKAIVVPTDQVLSYMDQPLLQQPRLVDSQGRYLIEGPDVSSDGCIYATPLEKNGIAHLNNFCIMYPYTGQVQAQAGLAATTGSSHNLLGQQSPSPQPTPLLQQSPSLQSLQPTPTPTTPTTTTSGGSRRSSAAGTRRARGTTGRANMEVAANADVSDAGAQKALVGSEVMQDAGDALSSGGELCLLVQLLRRDAQNPGHWYAYNMPHLISRPFQVIPRNALSSSRGNIGPLCTFSSPNHLQQQQQQQQQQRLLAAAADTGQHLLLAQGHGIATPRHSVAADFGAINSAPEQQHQHQRFMSPQYKRNHVAMGFGAAASSGMVAYDSIGPGFSMVNVSAGVMGLPSLRAPQEQQQQQQMMMDYATINGSMDMNTFGVGMGAIGGMGLGLGGFGASMGGMGPGGVVLPIGISSPMMGPMTVGGGGTAGGTAAGGFGAAERAFSSCLSAESPSGAGSQRGSRARRRSLLSKDSSYDDSSGVGAPMSTSGGATVVASLRTPSITSSLKPTVNSNGGDGGMCAAAAVLMPSTEAAVMTRPAPSPPFSPPPLPPPPQQQRMVHAVSHGSAMELERKQSVRKSDEGVRSLPLQLLQAPSATLLDLNISDLLDDIHSQPLLTTTDVMMMDMEEGAAKRVRSNTTTTTATTQRTSTDIAAFPVHNNHHYDHHNHNTTTIINNNSNNTNIIDTANTYIANMTASTASITNNDSININIMNNNKSGSSNNNNSDGCSQLQPLHSPPSGAMLLSSLPVEALYFVETRIGVGDGTEGGDAGSGGCGGERERHGGDVSPGGSTAPFDVILSQRMRCDWPMDTSAEQVKHLRKQSMELSGTHPTFVETDTALYTAAAANVATVAACAAAAAAATTGGNSRGSSASQLDLLIQMLSQQEGLDEMDSDQLPDPQRL